MHEIPPGWDVTKESPAIIWRDLEFEPVPLGGGGGAKKEPSCS